MYSNKMASFISKSYAEVKEKTISVRQRLYLDVYQEGKMSPDKIIADIFIA